MPKHPDIFIPMEGKNANAFAILGRVQQAIATTEIEWTDFHREATAGDYDHLIATVVRWFTTDLYEERATDTDAAEWAPYYG